MLFIFIATFRSLLYIQLKTNFEMFDHIMTKIKLFFNIYISNLPLRFNSIWQNSNIFLTFNQIVVMWNYTLGTKSYLLITVKLSFKKKIRWLVDDYFLIYSYTLLCYKPMYLPIFINLF